MEKIYCCFPRNVPALGIRTFYMAGGKREVLQNLLTMGDGFCFSIGLINLVFRQRLFLPNVVCPTHSVS